MGELLLLGSAHVIPRVLLDNGFQFLHPNIQSALSFELEKSLQKLNRYSSNNTLLI